MKASSWRQDRDAYPHTAEIQTRYGDEDVLRHVNNISVAVYYDEARARLMRHIFELAGAPSDIRIVTAESRISYAGELFYPQPVEVRSGILKVGNASFQIGQAVFQQGRYAGFCETVFVQASKTGAEPLHPGLRTAVEGMMIKGAEG